MNIDENETKNGMTINAYVPMDLLRQIDRSAKSEGLSRSAFLRRAAMIEVRKIDQENNPGNAAKLSPGPENSQSKELKPVDNLSL